MEGPIPTSTDSNTAILTGNMAPWPLVKPVHRIPLFGEILAILGGSPLLGRKPHRGLADGLVDAYFSKAFGRQEFSVAHLHFEGIQILGERRDVWPKGGGARMSIATRLIDQTFGQDRLNAIFSGIAQTKRTRYLSAKGISARSAGRNHMPA